MKCLVTGGAGYIGSHVALKLIEEGHEVDIIDNLSTGCHDALDRLRFNGWSGDFCESDIGDIRKVSAFIQEEHYDICLHFAGHISVGESVRRPIKYFENNIAQFPRFLSSLSFHGINNFIFSSSAGIYGKQKEDKPITEDSIINPPSPYGLTKSVVEKMLEAWSVANPNFKFTSLRYFNVCGNNMEGKIGDYRFQDKENLVPMCLSAVAGLKPSIKIYGTDYNTKDGTCIRDYIHVDDLADAHIVMMDKLDNKPYNVGNGVGYSVRELVDSCLKVTGVETEIEETGRRPGDPEYLCADASAFKNKTGWKPKITNIDDMTSSVWNWIKKTEKIT